MILLPQRFARFMESLPRPGVALGGAPNNGAMPRVGCTDEEESRDVSEAAARVLPFRADGRGGARLPNRGDELRLRLADYNLPTELLEQFDALDVTIEEFLRSIQAGIRASKTLVESCERLIDHPEFSSDPDKLELVLIILIEEILLRREVITRIVEGPGDA